MFPKLRGARYVFLYIVHSESFNYFALMKQARRFSLVGNSRRLSVVTASAFIIANGLSP